MKFISIIREIFWKISWRGKLCKDCSNLRVISNHSPCYKCILGCNYEMLERELNDEEM